MESKKNKIILGITIFVIAGIFIFYFFGAKLNFSFGNQVANIIDIKKEEKLSPPVISMLSRAELSFLGSTEARIENIKLSLSRINGTIIKPEEEFSFNKTLGPVLAEDGFQEANSFLNGEVILGIGGGICQVSTTLFESLVKAGLPITERHNHTFSVPYYTTGLDATVSQSGPDLKFKNDTGYDLEIKGYVTDNNTLVFEIYGVNDGREISISKAEVNNKTSLPQTKYIETSNPQKDGICEHHSQVGYTAKVLYNVLYKNGLKNEQVFNSIYQPLARTCFTYVNPQTGCTATSLYSPKTGIKCENSI